MRFTLVASFTTLLMAALAALAGVARWVTFRRAVRSGRFDDPVGAIFAVWLDRGDPRGRV